MAKLGVNVDHVAMVRQARRTYEPDPVWAAALAELGGADGITVHLRVDRRHIQDRDVRLLKETVSVKLNLEMSLEREIVEIACDILPEQCTLVPEKREEVTTEGGLDVRGQMKRVKEVAGKLKRGWGGRGVTVSLFIDPEEDQIRASAESGADAVELHTGRYANAHGEDAQRELASLRKGAELAHSLGLVVHAGHGLTYTNVAPVARLPHVEELNIGHSIVSRAVFVGIGRAVREMKELIA